MTMLQVRIGQTSAAAIFHGVNTHYPFQCWGYIRPKHKGAKIFEKHLNPVMLVFIRKLILSTAWWVPYARVSIIFQVFASFCIGQINHQLATRINTH